jgi:arsenate reductase
VNILVLCTGNSALSIMAEALINALSGGRHRGYSAGSQPKAEPHPLALQTLARHRHAVDGLASKSWDVFAEPGAPEIDAVITVCDSAAAEACPVWPAAPATAHWGLPDPAAIEDPDAARAAFEETYRALRTRIEAVLAADPDPADRAALKAALEAAHR